MSEAPQVPQAEFESYYGQPVIKEPVWKDPDVPLYLFLGGLAGASAVLAEGAAASNRPRLRVTGRALAAAGSGLGTIALIHDLGRPGRFLNMLRVFRPTSPLSMGSWMLAPFTGLSNAALASEITGWVPSLRRIAGAGAAALGPPLSAYTGILIANTAVPAWHEAYRELPFVFTGSGAVASGGLAMVATPTDQAGPARRMLLTGTVLDLGGIELIRRRLGMLAEPYEQGQPGRFLKAAQVCNLAGAAAALVGRRSRTVSVLGGLAAAAGSMLTRFGIYRAGPASARDPKYTVIPQRGRVDARSQAGAQCGSPARSDLRGGPPQAGV